MNAGRPSVDFRRWLVHICGTSWMHQKIVPMRPRMVAATGVEPRSCGVMMNGREESSVRLPSCA
jgi:hypothetical protein